jgi:uncharacterized membrane protein HdeD (DUF308 family)
MRSLRLTESDFARAATVLFLRGFLLAGLAAVAVRWPEVTLLTSMGTAGAIVGILGVFELAVAVFSGSSRMTRGLLFMHAYLSLTFAGVSLAVRFTSPGMTVALIALWLLLHAVLAVAVARVVPATRGRALLVAWAAANLVCALVVVAAPWRNMLTVLYVGAVYVWSYGVVQVSVAMWIRRHHPGTPGTRDVAQSPIRGPSYVGRGT